jgi:cytidyltransferase-like protein
MSKKVIVSGSFDNLRSRDVRFLEEASKFGELLVLLWSDETTRNLEGKFPDFPQVERLYLLQAIRYVKQVSLVTGVFDRDTLPQVDEIQPDIWIVDDKVDSVEKRSYSDSLGIAYQVLTPADLDGFPALENSNSNNSPARKKVLVTGCFDWFHSGHVRFFEETSQLGDLYVVLGHDANIRLLKGDGHPMLSQDERRYQVAAIRYVKQALISTGHGWMDAEPEIARIKPDIYTVNEDGDKPEKRAFCKQHGIDYVVLKRTPKEGLPRRESTLLRGF